MYFLLKEYIIPAFQRKSSPADISVFIALFRREVIETGKSRFSKVNVALK
jgi:hypothetical protein